MVMIHVNSLLKPFLDVFIVFNFTLVNNLMKYEDYYLEILGAKVTCSTPKKPVISCHPMHILSNKIKL